MESNRKTTVTKIRPHVLGGLLLGHRDVAIRRRQEHSAAQSGQLHAISVRGEQQETGQLEITCSFLHPQSLMTSPISYSFSMFLSTTRCLGPTPA